MFDRLEALIGKDNLDLISSKRIIVFGIGGVGGHVVESLVRSGIEDIAIVDGDTIEESNLNRQIIALRSTIGKNKVDVMKDRIFNINPMVKVQTINEIITEDDLENLHLEDYDYIVDAIDDVKVKVALAKLSLDKKFNLVMATGTAKKLDPLKLTITTLDKTKEDPLARVLRRELRGYDTSSITVLASEEKPISNDNDALGSSAFVPSCAGIAIASYIIRDIIK